MAGRPGSTTRARIQVIDRSQADTSRWRADTVVTEEPLQIRIEAGGAAETVAITMRTPGEDFALAAGLLASEGLVGSREELRQIAYCTTGDQLYNVVTVAMSSMPDLGALQRRGTVSSACGVCGKTSLESLQLRGVPPVTSTAGVDADVLFTLPDRLRAAQATFARTGGLHAAGLFGTGGDLILAREDVGRHNAVDKVVGDLFLRGEPAGPDTVLMVSGRAGFEILQKAAVAGIAVVASVSAPSSLAVDVAREFGITLVGFLRGTRCNVYSGAERVRA